MKNTSWVWKEIRREKSAKIVFLAISFSFLVTVLMFIVSGTFIKNVQKQTEDIYGYFDHILYHAEQNTDNLSFSQKKISKKYINWLLFFCKRCKILVKQSANQYKNSTRNHLQMRRGRKLGKIREKTKKKDNRV